jgi:6-phosphofructokinase 1
VLSQTYALHSRLEAIATFIAGLTRIVDFFMKKIAVLTSGGDSPGMNAAIRAVVRTAVYNDCEIVGVFQGYQGLVRGDFKRLHVRSVAKILGRGGTILKSARSEEFRTKEGRRAAHAHLLANEVDGLVVIGGNGTFTGAKIFYEETGFPVIGLPGTIDNDLAGTDFTIGFDTATNTVVEAVDKIRDTADSHNRLFFVEVMGRDSGFIALQTGIATGAIAVMTPETGIDVDGLVNILEQGEQSNKTSSIVIVAEGHPSGGAFEIAKMVHQRSSHYEVRVTVLGHLQRGGDPSCFDRVLASRLGVAAVEGLISGKCNVMAGFVNDSLVYYPFEEAIKNKTASLDDEVRIAKILSI